MLELCPTYFLSSISFAYFSCSVRFYGLINKIDYSNLQECIMLTRLLIFFVLNFAALGIGGLFTGQGVPSDWYQSLAKAPWTPPGWVFGAAWTTIMIAFSFFMAFLWEKSTSKSNLILLYVVQWVLNVAWNPTFFYAHQVLLGFVLISLLTAFVAFFLFRFMPVLRWKSLFILPYFVWLLIASSLNLYVYLYN